VGTGRTDETEFEAITGQIVGMGANQKIELFAVS
jgi:hypothetical protein